MFGIMMCVSSFSFFVLSVIVVLNSLYLSLCVVFVMISICWNSVLIMMIVIFGVL